MFLGIDTGGTYTDAVLYDSKLGVVCSGKALTTPSSLGIGISQVLDKVLVGDGAKKVQLVSLSTTLATNAIVEGQGEPHLPVAAGIRTTSSAAGRSQRSDEERSGRIYCRGPPG